MGSSAGLNALRVATCSRCQHHCETCATALACKTGAATHGMYAVRFAICTSQHCRNEWAFHGGEVMASVATHGLDHLESARCAVWRCSSEWARHSSQVSLSVAAQGVVPLKKWPHAACMSAMWDCRLSPLWIKQALRIEALLPSKVSIFTPIHTASMTQRNSTWCAPQCARTDLLGCTWHSWWRII